MGYDKGYGAYASHPSWLHGGEGSSQYPTTNPMYARGSADAPIDLTESPPRSRRQTARPQHVQQHAPSINHSYIQHPAGPNGYQQQYVPQNAPQNVYHSNVQHPAGLNVRQNVQAVNHSHLPHPGSSRKRCHASSSHEHEDAPPKKKAAKPADAEKRLRVHRKRAPKAYDDIRQRALTQRMFVLDRQRHPPPADIDPSSPDNHPTEVVSLAGTTGNVYQITISRVPSCTCPHARKGNQCKHIVYVLARVLRAREDLEYQVAFLSSELRQIFAQAPPLPQQVAEKDKQDGEMDGNRKPLEGEDCPICMEEFATDAKGKPKPGEVVVYCKAACGNNIHKACFQQWAATKAGQGAVTCPFCRSPWQNDASSASDLKGMALGGQVNEEGYVNVAPQLGLSGERDYSVYNRYWRRRHLADEYDDVSWW